MWEENADAYGPRKVWRQLKREGRQVARCTIERVFHADKPNQLRVAAFTYAATWTGFVFVAFAIDGFSRMIVGWRAAVTMTTDLTLDALERALWAR